MNLLLIIKRGLPGSGKSTEARKEAGTQGIVCSTDDFWHVDNPFDKKRLGEAHQWNQSRVREGMTKKVSPIVVDNVNNSFIDMQPYVLMADELGYKVQISEVQTPWKWDLRELVQKTVHNVPWKDMANMAAWWEPFDPLCDSLDKIRTPPNPFLPENRKTWALGNIQRAAITIRDLFKPGMEGIQVATYLFVSDPKTLDILSDQIKTVLKDPRFFHAVETRTPPSYPQNKEKADAPPGVHPKP